MDGQRLLRMVKSIGDFFRLIRWLDLLFIALIFFLVYKQILTHFYAIDGTAMPISTLEYILISLAFILMSAAGYALNDYYDYGMDEINKPDKLILHHKLPYKTGLYSFIILITLGILLSFYQCLVWKNGEIFIIYLFIAALFWFYSSKYKRELIIGNVIVSFIAALTIILPWLIIIFEGMDAHLLPVSMWKSMNFFIFSYAFLSFFITFAREIVKDIQDNEGDKAYGCQNIPIKYGIKTAKLVVTISMILILIELIYISVRLFSSAYNIMGYFFALVLIPFAIYIIIMTSRAKEKSQWKNISDTMKVYMLAGILSMFLITI
ncbi:MAG TPA: geranylgeranylglycerol-phosphate geranylgeranyltransferase [Bacteroidales bacterium]|nr:geranylgeranylglycerol-phosphate geranylgeranyltransferase [Bacteroidales bacterium]